jgi:hypothetical protein
MHRLYPWPFWWIFIGKEYFLPHSKNILSQCRSQHLWRCALRGRFVAQKAFIEMVDRFIVESNLENAGACKGE